MNSIDNCDKIDIKSDSCLSCEKDYVLKGKECVINPIGIDNCELIDQKTCI